MRLIITQSCSGLCKSAQVPEKEVTKAKQVQHIHTHTNTHTHTPTDGRNHGKEGKDFRSGSRGGAGPGLGGGPLPDGKSLPRWDSPPRHLGQRSRGLNSGGAVRGPLQRDLQPRASLETNKAYCYWHTQRRGIIRIIGHLVPAPVQPTGATHQGERNRGAGVGW